MVLLTQFWFISFPLELKRSRTEETLVDEHVDMFHLADLLQGISVDFSPVKDNDPLRMDLSSSVSLFKSMNRFKYVPSIYFSLRWNPRPLRSSEENQSVTFHVFS